MFRQQTKKSLGTPRMAFVVCPSPALPPSLLPKCCSALAESQRFRRSVRPLGFLETTMAIGLAALGLLAFLLGCSGTFAQPQNSERAAKEQLVGAGELRRECRFLVVDRTWCRRAERQRPWVPDRKTPSVSASVLGRDVCSLPPGLVLSLAAQMAERSASGGRPGRGLAVASTDGLWDAAPLPAPPGVGNLGGRCSLTGRWVNEKGSKIAISHGNNAGVFRGSYLGAVAATDNTIPPLMLQGIQHLDPQPTFGFILKSNISASSTVFVGQCFIDENAEEQLETASLLRAKVGITAEDWKAARAGRLVQPCSKSLCQGPASLSNCSQDLWSLWEAPGPISSPR
ncbi:avidin-like [Crotalus adamanteus]|uniref:Avidin-like n=1 Tax=Crotalus adamanteus TaxID=8729 RepID=A0AAW1C458_CROAD